MGTSTEKMPSSDWPLGKSAGLREGLGGREKGREGRNKEEQNAQKTKKHEYMYIYLLFGIKRRVCPRDAVLRVYKWRLTACLTGREPSALPSPVR